MSRAAREEVTSCGWKGKGERERGSLSYLNLLEWKVHQKNHCKMERKKMS